jgi:hypothetical protein
MYSSESVRDHVLNYIIIQYHLWAIKVCDSSDQRVRVHECHTSGPWRYVCATGGSGRGWAGQNDQVRKNVDISDFRQTHFLTSPPGRQKKYFGVIGRGLRARLVGGHTGTRPPIWRASRVARHMCGSGPNYVIV